MEVKCKQKLGAKGCLSVDLSGDDWTNARVVGGELLYTIDIDTREYGIKGFGFILDSLTIDAEDIDTSEPVDVVIDDTWTTSFSALTKRLTFSDGLSVDHIVVLSDYKEVEIWM